MDFKKTRTFIFLSASRLFYLNRLFLVEQCRVYIVIASRFFLFKSIFFWSSSVESICIYQTVSILLTQRSNIQISPLLSGFGNGTRHETPPTDERQKRKITNRLFFNNDTLEKAHTGFRRLDTSVRRLITSVRRLVMTVRRLTTSVRRLTTSNNTETKRYTSYNFRRFVTSEDYGNNRVRGKGEEAGGGVKASKLPSR